MSQSFFEAYVECALWSSSDCDDEPLDGYSIDDIAPETLAKMRIDCDDFQESTTQLIQHAYRTGQYSPGQAGHDFWLTRNGHGAGFWDRGLAAVGEQLTKDAKFHGSVDLIVCDDGIIRS